MRGGSPYVQVGKAAKNARSVRSVGPFLLRPSSKTCRRAALPARAAIRCLSSLAIVPNAIRTFLTCQKANLGHKLEGLALVGKVATKSVVGEHTESCSRCFFTLLGCNRGFSSSLDREEAVKG